MAVPASENVHRVTLRKLSCGAAIWRQEDVKKCLKPCTINQSHALIFKVSPFTYVVFAFLCFADSYQGITFPSHRNSMRRAVNYRCVTESASWHCAADCANLIPAALGTTSDSSWVCCKNDEHDGETNHISN